MDNYQTEFSFEALEDKYNIVAFLNKNILQHDHNINMM
jgi:hypothetical protein